MLVTIRPAPGGIGGVIAAPPSKSMAHRAVLCAALAKGRSRITNLEFSKDISATLSAAGQLCARVRTGTADAEVEGLGRFETVTAPVDCCESGSTLRFLRRLKQGPLHTLQPLHPAGIRSWDAAAGPMRGCPR